MIRILILGAGGHAQVVADIILRMQEAGEDVAPVGYLDDDPDLRGTNYLGLEVLGKLDDRSAIPHDAAIVAIGANDIRKRIYEQLLADAEALAVARHPSSILAPDVQTGAGSMSCAGVVVNTGTLIQCNVILNTGCSIDHHGHIGSHVHIAPGVHLGGAVTVGEGALIGIGATVLPGRRIGAWSIVGAGAVVVKDVPDRVVVAGVPASIIREL